MSSRHDLPQVKNGVALCQRFIPTIQGGMTRCPGTYYIGNAKTISDPADKAAYSPRLVSFEFSTTQAYIIEFGESYIRFWKDRAQLTLNGSAYEISSSYQWEDLFDLNFFQSNDVLFITHPSYRQAKLVRNGETSWSLQDLVTTNGPFSEEFDLGSASRLRTLNRFGTTKTGTPSEVYTPISAVSSVATASGTQYRVTTSNQHFLKEGEPVCIDSVAGSGQLPIDINNNTITRYHSAQSVGSTTFYVTAPSGTASGSYASAGTVYWAAFKDISPFGSNQILRFFAPANGTVDSYGTIGSIAHAGRVYAYGVMVGTESGDYLSLNRLRIGFWVGTSGFPATATIHEGRLCFYGTPADPTRLDASVVNDYENFEPSPLDNTGPDDSNAISFPLASNGVNAGIWLASDERGLIAGSAGQEWVVRPSVLSEALTPTNVSAKPATKWGSSNVAPNVIGKAVLFVQRAGRKLMEFQYFFDVDGFRVEDLTVLSEHMTLSGIKQMAHQKVPQSINWALRNDGLLTGVTYDRDGNNVKAAWHRHPIGGVSNASGDAAVVESIAVIPSPDGTSEEIYLLVRRWVNGGIVFHIEYMTQIFDASMEVQDAFFVDGGLTYDSPLTITAVGSAATDRVQVTSGSHSLSNGNSIRLSGIVGLPALNDARYIVASAATNTFQILDTGSAAISWNSVSGTGSYAYVSNGEVRKYVSTVSGMGHLQGETLVALVDGEPVSSVTIAGSAATFSTDFVTAHIGYSFKSRIQTLRFEAGAADGTSQGKIQRHHRMGLLLDRQGKGLKMGRDFDNLADIPLEDPIDLPLFSGFKSQPFEGDYSLDARVCIEQEVPLPSTILAVLPRMDTEDGG